MIKVYFLLLIFLVSKSHAQNVIFSQPEGVYPNNGAGFNCSKAVNGDFIGIANSFILTNTSNISRINIYGNKVGSSLLNISEGFILYIYNDINGLPDGNPISQTGVPVATVDITSASPGYSLIKIGTTSNYVYSADITTLLGNLTLQANTKYWLFFAAKLNTSYINPPYTQDFFWTTAALGTPGFMKISNLTGNAAYPSWTYHSYNGSAFSIEGTTLGTSESIFDSNDIVVYPNPTANYINIISKDKIKKISIYSLNGSQIIIKSNKNNVDLKDLPSGSYFLQVETENGNFVKKIIKK